MKKIFLFVMIADFLTWPLLGQKWTDNMYRQYNFNSFATSRIANQQINAQAVDYPLLHAAIFYMTNRERSKKGLPLLRHKRELEQAAHDHSKDMVKYNFFSHQNPRPGKRTPSQRLKRVGIEGTIGENIIQQNLLRIESNQSFYPPSQNGGYFSFEYRGKPIENYTYLRIAQKCLDRWMNSPPHRQNILDAEYEYLGCGAALKVPKNRDRPASFSITQNFAGQLE